MPGDNVLNLQDFSNKVKIRRGTFAKSRGSNNILETGEMAWLVDKDILVAGNDKTVGGFDFIKEKLVKEAIELLNPIADRVYISADSTVEQISIPNLKVGSICFRRDINEVFILKRSPSNIYSNWFTFTAKNLLGLQVLLHEDTIPFDSWRRIAYLPYGVGSCKLTLSTFSNSTDKFYTELIASANSPANISLLGMHSTTTTSGKPIFDSVRISNNKSYLNDGTIIEIHNTVDVNNLEIKIQSYDFEPEWQLKPFDSQYQAYPDSNGIMFDMETSFGSTVNIYEGNKKLKEKYMSVDTVNFDKNTVKENLGLKGLEVDMLGRLVLNGEIIFTPSIPE